ncbi:hypothetical protein KHA80_18205 [Anaerobacillus sp. HL2]|nr:hypothetical protein KHA80_18205 [Anaerobacillus sp. HL2]
MQAKGVAHELSFGQAFMEGQASVFRFFFLLVGFGLASVWRVSIVAYLNLITTTGYTFICI